VVAAAAGPADVGGGDVGTEEGGLGVAAAAVALDSLR